MSVVYCQGEGPASGRSLVERSSMKCGVSDCDREAALLRRRWATKGMLRDGRKSEFLYFKQTARFLHPATCVQDNHN